MNDEAEDTPGLGEAPSHRLRSENTGVKGFLITYGKICGAFSETIRYAPPSLKKKGGGANCEIHVLTFFIGRYIVPI